MHGNEIFCYFKDLDFRSKIEKCKQFTKMVRCWTVASKIPPSIVGVTIDNLLLGQEELDN